MMLTARRSSVSTARSMVKGLALTADLVRRPRPGITILIYHRVGAGSGGQMDLDPAVFERQLSWLVDTQRIIPLDEAVAELAPTAAGTGTTRTGAKRAGANRAGVVLTFDDGTTDWVDNVLPLLERYRVPATFYVATSFVDERREFPGQGRPISWAGLTELASSQYVTIGSHTHRHMLLDRLDPTQIDEELDRATELLGEHLGVTPAHFAYPKAVAGSPAAEDAVRKRFRSAVLAGTRANRPGADLHRLARSPIQASDAMGWFRHKARGRMHLEDDLRSLANRARYRELDA